MVGHFCNWVWSRIPKSYASFHLIHQSSLSKASTGLTNFITGVKSGLMGTLHNKTEPNISKGETEALKTLVIMQKTRAIVIKPCDKGAGICITKTWKRRVLDQKICYQSTIWPQCARLRIFCVYCWVAFLHSLLILDLILEFSIKKPIQTYMHWLFSERSIFVYFYPHTFIHFSFLATL